jgi:uncharacterized protein YutE (UPF0331/DUF86 family)
VIDEGRVVRLLRHLTDRVHRLDAARSIELGQRTTLWLDAVKYLEITAVECCIDIAQHIGSASGFPPPSTNAHAIRLLGDNGVISSALAHELSAAVGFRNVLVHQYIDVDDDIVIAALERSAAFTEFVSDVARWIEARRP